MRPDVILAQLAGTYTMLNISRTVNGVLDPNHPPFEGTIIYTASGYFAATMYVSLPEVRPQHLNFPGTPGTDDANWALLGLFNLDFSGPVKVNESYYVPSGPGKGKPGTSIQGQLLHGPIMAANIPNWIGTWQSRDFEVVREKQGSGKDSKKEVQLLKWEVPPQTAENDITTTWWRKVD